MLPNILVFSRYQLVKFFQSFTIGRLYSDFNFEPVYSQFYDP